MTTNVQGHEAFHKPFTAWIELCRSIKSKKSEYDAEEIIKTTRAFADALVPHLTDEIQTLSSQRMQAAFSKQELGVLDNKVEKKFQAETSLIWGIPMMFVNNDATAGSWFPPVSCLLNFYWYYVYLTICLVSYPRLSSS
jgi:hypothetical protein